jgi:hypothetical protein
MSVMSMRRPYLSMDPAAKPGREHAGSCGDPSRRSRQCDAVLAPFRLLSDFPAQVIAATRRSLPGGIGAARPGAGPFVMSSLRGSRDHNQGKYVGARVTATAGVVGLPTSALTGCCGRGG